MGIIVYPPGSHQTDSSTIFFIGSAIDSCFINDQKVELVHAGNFCPVFELELGENIFRIELDGESLIFNIRRDASFPSSRGAAKLRRGDPLFSWSGLPSPFLRICLDPGHGGSAAGTCSPKGIKEKDLNLQLAKMIRDEMIGSENISGQTNNNLVTTFLTRELDVDVSLADRVKIACENDCDLFISVHHNAIPDDQKPLEHRGISVHYYYDENIPLAEKILLSLTTATQLPSAGIIKQDLHVLRENTTMPALLIEFGYLIHPLESEIISSLEFQKQAAEALTQVLSQRKA